MKIEAPGPTILDSRAKPEDEVFCVAQPRVPIGYLSKDLKNKPSALRKLSGNPRHSQKTNGHISKPVSSERSPRPELWSGPLPLGLKRFPDGEIVRLDALEFLKALNHELADVVFLDPPFNLGKKYGRSGASRDRLEENKYLQWMKAILDSSIEVLRPGGALFLYHIPRWAAPLATHLLGSLNLRAWIAISMTNGMPPPRRPYPSHYALLYFTKGSPRVFRKVKLRAPTCPHCGRYLKSWGGRKKFLTNGVNLSDIWVDVSPIRHRRFKHRRANELPSLIPARALDMSGAPGGVVVDPFFGAGTTFIEARRAGMRFVGADSDLDSFRIASRRLTLPTRRQEDYAD